MSTISGTTVNSTVTLGSGTYTSPLTIASGAAVVVSGAAIFAASTYGNPTLVNYGSLINTGTSGFAVDFEGGGSVFNSGTGALIEAVVGVYIKGTTGTVANAGTILGIGNYGVNLNATGSVGNTGLIKGYGGVVIGSGTVTNSGTIVGNGGSDRGVSLFAGGVANTGSGLIEGYAFGIRISQPGGAVSNSATILGTGGGSDGVYMQHGGSVGNDSGGLIQGASGVILTGATSTVVNAGAIVGTAGDAIRLQAGGPVTNSGTIAANGANSVGIYLDAGGTIINSGTISGAYAIKFAGTNANLLVVEPGSVLGPVFGGIYSFALNTLELTSAASVGTLTNLGFNFRYFDNLRVDNGAQWALTGRNTIAGQLTLGALSIVTDTGSLNNPGEILASFGRFIVDSGTLINGGYVSGTATLAGISYLDNTGKITSAGTVVYGVTGASTVVNSGTIATTGTTGRGVLLNAGGNVANSGSIYGGYGGVYIAGGAGTLDNAGTILSSISYYSVDFSSGGYVTNSLGGYVGIGIDIAGGAGTVVNAGKIADNNGNGINLAAGGSVSNTGTGTITGTNDGILLNGAGSVYNAAYIRGSKDGISLHAVSTVTNSGTIAGSGGVGFFGIRFVVGGTLTDSGTISATGGTAVYFGGTAASLVVLDPGYALGGGVTGSTTVGATNRLELASAGVAGTVTATKFTNFATVAVDAGAQWTLTGTSTLASGITLAGGAYLDNTGAITSLGTAVVGMTSPNTVVNSGTIVGATNATGVFLNGGGSVTNIGTGLIAGGIIGVYISGSAALRNAGTLKGTGGFYTVYFKNGGYVTNSSGGYIGATGVGIRGAAGTVENAGQISNTHGDGVFLYFGGSVSNTGTITGYNDGILLEAAGTIDNQGLIQGAYEGVVVTLGAAYLSNSGRIVGTGRDGVGLNAGSTINNSGTIEGTRFGVYLLAGTVIDSGTISGLGGTAISFGGSGSNLLALEAGYKLSGAVYGGSSASNTLELAGTVGAAVTASYNGLGLINFGHVLFGPDGHDTLLVSNTTGTLPATLSGFVQSTETLDLTGIAGGTLANNGTVSGGRIVVSNGSETMTLNVDGTDATVFAAGSDGATGTDITPVCYRRGTLILTPQGEVAIEDLAIGDELVTLSGKARPIRWIGRRAYDGRFVGGNRAVLPIRVTAGALADGVPARDLFVSPEHALYVGGVLVQAKHLVNGATIVQPDAVESLEYFHLELDSHDIVFADGAAAESYVDCDNRWMFHNGAEYAGLYPDDDRQTWQFCLPRLEWGDEALAAIRAGLLARAAAQGHAFDTDPQLHLVADGEIVWPDVAGADSCRFRIPAGCAAVWLVSRHVVPAEIAADAFDVRRLGVALERLVLSDGDLVVEAWHGHEALADGFHEAEATHRWTDGRARLPEAWLRLFAGRCTLDVHLAVQQLSYRLPRSERTPVAA